MAKLSLFIIFTILVGPASLTKLSRWRRAAPCLHQFQCDSGACVAQDLVCDGTEDCADGSDEQNCTKSDCPGHLATCAYGACIEKNKVCNGAKDCRDWSDEANCNTTLTNSNCKKTEFGCKSGGCIKLDEVCNGLAQCPDGSDETEVLCAELFCPGQAFRCNYGGCVDAIARCNRIKDCVDNSDEDPKICGKPTLSGFWSGIRPKPTSSPNLEPTKPPTSSSEGCVLPPHPEHGTWSIPNSFDNAKQPGDFLASGQTIQFQCNKGFKNPVKFASCTGTTWDYNNETPQCYRLCQAYSTTETITVTCRRDGFPWNCSEAIDGTTLKYDCAPYYVNPQRTNSLYCDNGRWDYQPICDQDCGQEFVGVTTLIIDGEDVAYNEKSAKYPWQVGIYRSKATSFNQICGGSLINRKVVLSAAHCFHNSKNVAYPQERFRVAVGKYFRDYSDSRDQHAQFSEIDRLILSKEYRGSSYFFLHDIALIVTKTTFDLSDFVQPVCLMTNSRIFLQQNQVGIVTGWGNTESGGSSSETLKELSVPYQTKEECLRFLPAEWSQNYYSEDKICAGFYNKSKSVCKGDSGGPLVFRNLRDNNRYYLHGIVSVTPTDDQKVHNCNPNQFALYTSVQYHLQSFIEPSVSRYGAKIGRK